MQFFLIISSIIFNVLGVICHTDKGTDYGQRSVDAYVESNHGPDGRIFLDPYFKQDLENLNNQKLLDAGCGAAPWAIYAAKHGGDVYAIDIQESMISAAEQSVKSAGLCNKVSLKIGDVAVLPYENCFFDKAISICVGCNLPLFSFEHHFSEIYRTLKRGGIAVIAAPTSLDIVFTNDSTSDERTSCHISEILDQLPSNPSPEVISAKLMELNEVLSATFFLKNNRLKLLIDESELVDGEEIWRKLPKLVVPNRFYTKNTYIRILNKYKLRIQKIDLPHFENEATRIEYNTNAPFESRLGSAYTRHAPFVIFHVLKDDI